MDRRSRIAFLSQLMIKVCFFSGEGVLMPHSESEVDAWEEILPSSSSNDEEMSDDEESEEEGDLDVEEDSD